MEYLIDVYFTDAENNYRYALGYQSEKTLFVIGLNPSTACDKTPDNTIRKVMGFAERNGYASFVMFNLYPKRATYPHASSHKKKFLTPKRRRYQNFR